MAGWTQWWQECGDQTSHQVWSDQWLSDQDWSGHGQTSNGWTWDGRTSAGHGYQPHVPQGQQEWPSQQGQAHPQVQPGMQGQQQRPLPEQVKEEQPEDKDNGVASCRDAPRVRKTTPGPKDASQERREKIHKLTLENKALRDQLSDVRSHHEVEKKVMKMEQDEAIRKKEDDCKSRVAAKDEQIDKLSKDFLSQSEQITSQKGEIVGLKEAVAAKDKLLQEWQACHADWVKLLQDKDTDLCKSRDETEKAKKDGDESVQKVTKEFQARLEKSEKELRATTEKLQGVTAASKAGSVCQS